MKWRIAWAVEDQENHPALFDALLAYIGWHDEEAARRSNVRR